jgi:hypothetical protein
MHEMITKYIFFTLGVNFFYKLSFALNLSMNDLPTPVEHCAIVRYIETTEITMKLLQFTIVNTDNKTDLKANNKILINEDHIVSIKPINIMSADKRVIQGFWIRLSNGKKYKAISVPKYISDHFNESTPKPVYLNDNSVEMQLH